MVKEKLARVLLLPVSVGVWYCVIVLFGASVYSQFYNTLILASMLTLFATMPFVLICKNIDEFFDIVYNHNHSSMRELMADLVFWGACGGCWCGAAAIPLDWNRWWQAYPIPLVAGLLAGVAVSLMIFALYTVPSKWRRSTMHKLRKSV